MASRSPGLAAGLGPQQDPDLAAECGPSSGAADEPVEPGAVRLRIELLPMSFLARAGADHASNLNPGSLIADAPMTHSYGQKVGTDAYRHGEAPQRSTYAGGRETQSA